MEEKKRVPSGFGKRVKKDDKYEWQDGSFESDAINPNKKVVLCFNGNLGTNNQKADGVVEFVEGLIGRAEENGYDLFAFYYGHKEGIKEGGFSIQERQDVFNHFFKPFLFDKGGNLLPEKSVERNLQNLRIYAYCKGMDETNELLQKTNELLSENFGERKSKKLLENVFIVSFAPFNEPKFGTNVEFKDLNDDTTREPWFISKNMSSFGGGYPYTGLAQVEFNKSKNGLEVFSNSFLSVTSTKNAHRIRNYLKDNGVISRDELLTDEFGDRIYSRQQAISDMIGISLAYGIVNDKPDLNDLKDALTAQLNQDSKNEYEKEQKDIFENGTALS